MTITQRYKRHEPNTICGHSIELSIVYSDFDEREIDKLEEEFRKSIGSGTVMTFDKTQMMDLCNDLAGK